MVTLMICNKFAYLLCNNFKRNLFCIRGKWPYYTKFSRKNKHVRASNLTRLFFLKIVCAFYVLQRDTISDRKVAGKSFFFLRNTVISTITFLPPPFRNCNQNRSIMKVPYRYTFKWQFCKNGILQVASSKLREWVGR